VVLGHSSCGAIQATLEELHRPTTNQSPNLKDIVDRIRPAVGAGDDEPAAMRANILASVNQLRHGSAIIEGLVGSSGLVVVGAWYSLDTSVVEFLEQTLPA
jgi:carbonic anhydrase